MSNTVTPADLAAFIAALNAKLAEWHVHMKNIGGPPTVEVMMGPKYARLVRVDSGRSAYGFVDLMTGGLLKADGWKKPAKGVRGSIFGQDCLAGCTPYGMAYNYK